jgi:hypothetical protein
MLEHIRAHSMAFLFVFSSIVLLSGSPYIEETEAHEVWNLLIAAPLAVQCNHLVGAHVMSSSLSPKNSFVC